MYRQVFNDFKAIMRDKNERKEFIGGFASYIVMFALVYVVIYVFH